MKLVERVTKYHNFLSENDILIWEFISHNSKKCENLSIEELAKLCHVSKTTILRFAKRIGLSGYSEFKLLLKMENKVENKPNNAIENLQNGYNNYIDNMKKKDFFTLSKMIYEAKNVFIHARGAVQRSVADELYRAFLPLNKLFFRIKTMGETNHYEQNITKDDIAIIISYSGQTEESVDFVKKLKLKGTKIIVITATKDNTLQKIADHGIYIEPIMITDINNFQHPFLAEYFILIDILTVSYIEYLKTMEGDNEH